jgi:hypothetical protein
MEALACTGDDGSHLALSGAFLDVSQPNAHFLVGADGGHLYSANSFCFELNQSCILPNRKFLHWPGFAGNAWRLAAWLGAERKPCWVQIKSGPWTFLTKTVDAEYPQWRNVLPEPEREKTVVVLSEKAKRCLLDAVPLMPGRLERMQPVTLIVRENQLVLRGRAQLSEFWTELAVPETSIIGKSIEVCLNRNHLLKALQMDLLRLELSAGNTPILFRKEGKTLVAAQLEGSERKAVAAGKPPVSPTATCCSAPEHLCRQEERLGEPQNNGYVALAKAA